MTGTKAGTLSLCGAPKGWVSSGPIGVVVPCPQVNGVCVEGKQHADVVAAIKAGGDETRLLVVDVLTDEFFKKCKVVPSEEHLSGGLGTVLQGEGIVPPLSPCHQTWETESPQALDCEGLITLGPSRVT